MARLTVRILICLTLGAATSVGVAWGIVVFRPIGLGESLPRVSSYSDDVVWARLTDQGGVTSVYAGTSRWLCGGRGPYIEPRILDSVPQWMEPHREEMLTLLECGEQTLFSASLVGSPFRCLRTERWIILQEDLGLSPYGTRSETLHTIKLNVPWLPDPSRNMPPTGGLKRELPTGILALGMAANTAIYASGWLLLLAAPRGVCRWRRSRRGLCVKCGYDLHGVDNNCCPECGGATVTPPLAPPSHA